jgi:hypothetical protein
VLSVRRIAADGRETVTVKERPPAPYAAWTAAAVVAVNERERGTTGIRPAEADTKFERDVLARIIPADPDLSERQPRR